MGINFKRNKRSFKAGNIILFKIHLNFILSGLNI